MNVLIVDDQLQFRERLLSSCRADPKCGMVAVADTSQEVIEATSLFTPDLIFFDERLLGDCGLSSAVDTIRVAHAHVRIVFLSEDPSEESLVRAYQYGSSGYLTKGSDVINLLPAILRLKPGEFLLSPKLTYMAIGSLRDFRDAVDAFEINQLTGREKEVLRQVCAGLSNRRIAQNLVISENTVRIHIQNLLKKLKLQNRRQVQEKYGLLAGIIFPAVDASTAELREADGDGNL